MADALAGVSDGLALTVAKAGESVVRVEGRRRMSASGIVWSADGVIVTAHHVVQRDDAITLGLANGETAQASLVGRDPGTDIAVLRTETKGLSTPAWAEADGLRVGHLALALGRPGRSVHATLGIISALGSSWRTPAGGRLNRYWQADLVMYPGFSGGPLVDASGQLLGMNTSALLRGASVTVSQPDLQRTVEALLTHGRVRRGYLGVTVQPVRLPEGTAEQLGKETGLLIVSIEPGAAAEQGGLYLGDTLVSIGGEPLRSMDDLQAQLSSEQIGQVTAVRILRGGQVQELSVAVGERP